MCVRCNDPLPELGRAPFEQPAEELTRLRRATGNRYRVLHRLGGGGMAEVYVAEQVQLARRVVIKGAEHSPNAERPAETAAALIAFWAQAQGRPTESGEDSLTSE